MSSQSPLRGLLDSGTGNLFAQCVSWMQWCRNSAPHRHALCALQSLSGYAGHSRWCLWTICGTSLGLQSLLGLEDRAVAHGEVSIEEIRHPFGCGPEVNGQRHAFIGFGFSDRIFGNPWGLENGQLSIIRWTVLWWKIEHIGRGRVLVTDWPGHRIFFPFSYPARRCKVLAIM